MTTSPTPTAGSRPPYWCFISYRHADNKDPGRQWATWMHQQIETYEVPEDLVGTVNERGQTIPERIFPVFRDEEELPADADLGSPIYRALDRSLFLLVLCSPRAVESTYVADEITYFKKLGRSNCVLAAMLEGEPNASWDEGKRKAGVDPKRECFPEPLQFLVDENGELDRTQRAEPIAADFRLPNGSQGWTSPEAFRQSISPNVPKSKIDELVNVYQKQCELARLKIIAGILGVPLGTLTKRDKAYQLEKERKRAKIFRSVATALGLLAIAATGAGVYAFLKREEAVANQGKAETATELAIQNQHRAESAEGEAKDNLERATGLLWEASYNAWNEAERSYQSDDSQAALAYLAAGMRNAPDNTGLMTFAASILAEGAHPVRTLHFDLPIGGVSYTRPAAELIAPELIVAELYYSAGVRFSLWNAESAEKLDEIIIAADTEISDEQKAKHPWLEFAPTATQTNNSEHDKLEVAWSPCSMRGASAGQDHVSIKGEGLSWSHPWYDFEAERVQLPNSGWANGYSWSPDGNRLATGHGFNDAVTTKESGYVHIWDLRVMNGFALQPDKVTPFSEINPDDFNLRAYGDFLINSKDDGHEVYRKGNKELLWSVKNDQEKERLDLYPFSAANEAVLLRMSTEIAQDVDKPTPLKAKLELRELTTGKILASAELSFPESSASSGFQLSRHPNAGFLLSGDAALFAWDGTSSVVTTAEDLGPEDAIGWSGGIAFLPSGESVVLGTHRKLLHLTWPELKLIAGPRYHETIVSSLAVHPNSKLLVSGAGFGDGAGSAGYAQVWTLPDLQPLGPRLNHSNQIESVNFLADGSTFVSSTESPEGSDMRIWNSQTSLPLTNYLTAPPGSGQAFLSFSGYEDGPLATISASGDVDSYGKGTFSTRLPTPKTAVPAWFYEHFIPFCACKELTAQGSLQAIPASQLHEHYSKVAAHLAASDPNKDDVYHGLARWQLANVSGRSLSPYGTITMDDMLEERFFKALREGKAPATAAAAYGMDASHPLLHLHLALNEEDVEKKLHYLRYGYYRISRPTNEAIYGKERWHAQLRMGKKLLTILKQPAAAEQLEKLIKGE